jgi:hypothetical protein
LSGKQFDVTTVLLFNTFDVKHGLYVLRFLWFMFQNIVPIGQVVLSPQPGFGVSQLAWNPVNAISFCVCLTSGGIAMFNIKSPGSVELINALPSANAT